MALNFPDSPALNDIYTDSTSGFSYQWDGTVWKSYSSASTNNIRTLDDISASFNGVTNSFALTVSGSAVTPANAQQLLISVGGVMQSPNTDYTISGSSIIFTTPPISGLTFFGTIIGTAVPVGITTVGEVYRQQSYAVTGVQTSFSFPAGYTVGYLEVYRNGVRLIDGSDFTATDGSSFDLITPAQNGDDVEAVGYITASIAVANGNLTSLLVNNDAQVLGVTTLGTNVGAGQTALLVQGNARVTGILTVGTSSLTLNGNTNTINGITVSAGIVTASSFVGNLTGTASTATSASNAYGLLGTPNLNVGVITATSFSGDGSGLSGVGPSQQAVTSASPTTTIDLSLGNVIYFTHNTNTTVAFANTSTTQEVTFIRTKDDTDTARSITWPSNIRWPNFGEAPILTNVFNVNDNQTFKLVTRDGGSIWYGWEEQRYYGDNTFLYAWGDDAALGQNNRIDQSSPIQIPGASWSSIAGNDNHVLATKTDGTLWAWGSNNVGQLGQNNRTSYSSPRQIPGTSWSSTAGGTGQHSLATKTDGTLWVWGWNDYGQLGQNNITSYSSPVQIPGTSWNSISGGTRHSLTTKTDGTLWGWGGASDGRLGQNDQTYQSSPVQIPGTSWSNISARGDSSFSTKTDGTLWSWGQNQFGQLGQNNTIRYSSPIQIPGTQWSSISGGSSHSLATKTDGTLWAWGASSSGRLGLNDTILRSSPVQVSGTQWSSISGGSSHSLGTKTDGTLWAWGEGTNGKLGQNNTTNHSNPIQIPGNYWGRQITCTSGSSLSLSKNS